MVLSQRVFAGKRARGTRSADPDPKSTKAEGITQKDVAHGNTTRRDWALAFGGAILLWCAFPPVGFWPLAWVAPLFWLRLISQPNWSVRRPYRMLYLVGLLHWLLLIHWIRLPHWTAYFGWLALAGYLAVYPPLFVAISRGLTHRWRFPIVLAAPIAWTACELLRGHLLSGFSISLLSHTQLPLLPLVQIADVTGAYGVSFLIMLVAASLERALPQDHRSKRRLAPLLAAVATLVVCWIYGSARIQHLAAAETVAENDGRVLQVALIQGSFDTQFGDPKIERERIRQAFFDYVQLAQRAARQHDDLDLMIWPESMFTGGEPMVSYEEPLSPVPGWRGTDDQWRERLDQWRASIDARLKWVAQQTKTPMVAGIGREHFQQERVQRYNSAIHVDDQGRLIGTYDKMHRVMFGEYVPLGSLFPWLYRLTPMPSGIEPGQGPSSFTMGDLRLSPAICFENTVPHLIRRQVRQLSRDGTPPDILVTVTNDGWFWGSSLLDVHLACGVFRAIEMRRPHLIAANTGFSASIDASGRVNALGPRRAPQVVLARVVATRQASVYQTAGDVFAGFCLALSSLTVVPRRRVDSETRS